MADYEKTGKSMSEEQAAALEAGRLLFARECHFVTGIARLDQLPAANLTEVAFAGRSNVGKSSLINALTGRRALARASNTPGRTQQINFFDLNQQLMLVDLPGFGFAEAPKALVAEWTNLVANYLKGRAVLRRVCLLVDGRHGLKDTDRDVMTMLDDAAVPYQLVLTKVDKVKSAFLNELNQRTSEEIAKRRAAHPEIINTSAETSQGVAELRATLAALAANR
ncbi:MAG TPA: YihA family ribosome biogenesis GTP-binding protein [Rhodospirillaceae bacterium]|nr:YihA family ribosome biogenesis GTP-binding protein [Rhodospirillaceae bacterium]